MSRKFLSTLLFILIISTGSLAQSNKVKVIKVPEMVKLTKAKDDQVKVINYWATWCKPCIKELPYFVQAARQYPNVEFIFISLDFADQTKRVNSFAQKKELTVGELYLIDDLDYNSWIDKISPEWSGAIPATLIVNGDQKKFYEREFHDGELTKIIEETLNNN